jgi:hypothetical protein
MDKVIIKSPMILLFCTVMEDVQEKLICDLVYIFMYKSIYSCISVLTTLTIREKLICDLVYIFMYKCTHHVDNQTVSHSRVRPFCMHAYLLLIRHLPFWLLFL